MYLVAASPGGNSIMKNDSTEITKMVNTERIRRRAMYESMKPLLAGASTHRLGPPLRTLGMETTTDRGARGRGVRNLALPI
jgi:hypothetical protein